MALKELISIIVPVYNIKEEYLKKCVESILNQHTEEYRVILVDDGSTDLCGVLCDGFARESDRVTVIHQENQGVSVARNTGMDAADTPWITFVDPDDWMEASAIRKEIELINALDTSADIIMFDYAREYRKESVAESLPVDTGFCDDALVAACQRAPFFKLIQKGSPNPYSINALWNKVYRKDFLDKHKIRFVPEARKGQDRLFNADAFNSTDRIYYLHECLYRYRCNNESVSNKYNRNIVNLTNIEIRSLEQIIEKHHLPSDVKRLLNARICTRLYSCMRLNFFHPENPLPEKQMMAELKALVDSESYKTAIQTAPMQYLSAQEIVFLCALKWKMYRLCGVLVRMKASRFGNKLVRE